MTTKLLTALLALAIVYALYNFAWLLGKLNVSFLEAMIRIALGN